MHERRHRLEREREIVSAAARDRLADVVLREDQVSLVAAGDRRDAGCGRVDLVEQRRLLAIELNNAVLLQRNITGQCVHGNYANRISAQKLRYLFAVVLLFISLQMLYHGLFQ